jgi:hypothetical protein
MRKILLARLSTLQTAQTQLEKSRNVLHPCSEGAKKFSIEIFECKAKISEIIYLLNLAHENQNADT